ncbi:MAG: phosphoglucosamine mutase [Algisphaera sp.]
MTQPNPTASSPAPLMLGISGMRGLVGQSLKPELVCRYAAAFGHWLKSARNTQTPTVVLGRDSRPSGAMYEDAVAAGLASVGCKVIRVGIISTPGVAIMGDHHKADGGMVITASHNPKPWNGVKLLRHDGVAPPPDEAKTIIQLFNDNAALHANVDDLHPGTSDNTGAQIHLDRVTAIVDIEAIRAAKLKVVVDSVHGAGGDEAALLLDHLGVERVHLYAQPTGHFPHVPEPTRENLTELCAAVKQHGADVGFAQDPDADRLALVDENGTYIGEEYTLVLCAMAQLQSGDTTVANLSTSRMIDDVAAAVGATVIRTPVGEANVAAGMREHNATVGGEGNGGIIYRPITQVRDSVVGMAMVCELLAKRGKPLSKHVAATPAYAMIKDKIEIVPGSSEPTLAWTAQHFKDQKVDTQDGVRVDWPDRWVHVRPSNTEPILRIIAEAAHEADARALVDTVRQGIASLNA